MSRMPRLATIAILVLWLSLAGPLQSLAQEAGFTETFEDPGLTGWEHSPEVVVLDGVLRISPGNFAARPGAWENFDLTLKLRYNDPGEILVGYRVTDQGRYILHLADNGLRLERHLGDTPTMLGQSASAALQEGAWLEVHILVKDGQHQVSLDQELLITAADDQPIRAGMLFLEAIGQRTVEFDEIRLTPGGEVSPQGPAPVQPVSPAATPTLTTSTQPTGLDQWINQLFAVQGLNFDLPTIIVNLLLSVVAAFILAQVYIHWGASLSNRRKFAANFALVTVTTTFIILVVRSSVALSLGLVGALSIIRFRAAIKEPEELAYLFFAISLGIGLGDNQRLLSLLTLLILILTAGGMRLFRRTQADVNMHLSIASRSGEKVSLQQILQVVERNCSKYRLLRFDETPEALELTFAVELRRTSDLENVRLALLELSPSLQISFLDNRGVW